MREPSLEDHTRRRGACDPGNRPAAVAIGAALIVIGHRDLSRLDRFVGESAGRTRLASATCRVLVGRRGG